MNEYKKGLVMAFGSASLWGISGSCGQFLFQERHISVEWLMGVRMIGAGLILLLAGTAKKDRDVFHIWKTRYSATRLLFFGLVASLAVQYTYYAAIKYSNAATATVLQFSAPVIVAVYLAIKDKQRLRLPEYAALILAVTGTFLLVTHGNLSSLSISLLALVYGLACAVAVAVYTLFPINLLKKHSSLSVVGWGFLLGGVAISFIKAPWHPDGIWDIYTFAGTIFVIIFGALIPFYIYIKAVKIIGGQKASVLMSAEPLTAAVIGVVWLGVHFALIDWLGMMLIISTVVILSVNKGPLRH